MPDLPANFSDVLTTAIGLLDEGKEVDADDLMLRHTDKTREEFGDPSSEYASALFEHGLLLYRANDFECVDFMRVAALVAGQSEDSDQLLGRITLTLGDLLSEIEKYDEARDVLIQSASSRAKCYGEDDIEYAKALHSLGFVEWMRGNIEESLEHLKKAEAIFVRCNDALMFDNAALRSAVHKSADDGERVFEQFSRLSTVDIGKLIDQVTVYLDRFSWQVQAKIFEELYTTVATFENALYLQQAALAEQTAFCCRNAGEYQRSELYWRTAMAIAERNNDTESLLSLKADLALTLLEGGEHDRAETLFIEVMSECQKQELHGLVAFALRKYGRLLEASGRIGECEAYLNRAIEAARKSDDGQDAGLALAELGVFLHHQGRYEQAEPLLREAIQLIRPEHGWHGMVLDHMEATSDDHACGCTDDEEIYHVVSDIIASANPVVQELLGDVRIDRVNQIQFNLRREPNTEEEDILDAFSDELLDKVKELRRNQKRAL